MRHNIWTLFVFCAIVSALASAKHGKRSKPSATVNPAEEFGTEEIATTTTPTTTTPTTTTPTTTTPTTTTPTTTTPTTTTPTTTTPTTTTAKTTTTTAATTTAKTTTTTAATTTAKTTTTTAATTTAKTTTTAATTTAKTTTTTTAATTTAKTTTTAATTTETTTTTPVTTTPTTTSGPTPPLTAGNYSLKNDKGETCLMAHMALQIKLTTLKANGTFTVQPQQATVKGSCQTSPANLTLSFPEGFITFIFSQDKTANLVYVNTLSFQLSYTFSSVAAGNGDYKGSNNSLKLFGAKIGHCYSCKSDSIYLGNGLSLEVTQERMQAFNVTGNTYGHTDVCRADQSDYRVAIAVGVILGVLIIIVLVAYLLGRRRKAQGYQSL